ncbi:hypothetical protein L1276_003675 [Flavobacterium sp. HSC-32F16]|uniref:nuclear transport factor 2 family protein n=1 Tax=Flavobacterium sp. HSC-32F16 TaxID=2910964 RepID=UPI0020A357D2|nr:nuclear transport factor 2 family protein [Flavobacterium sp. HSC-32F16]MCP2028505.1 hypothetical protein [Flavobacterium sp. HSC-32F16]
MENKPTVEEIVEINQLLALWGHILDSHNQERYAEVLMDDCFYDCSIFGFETATGIEAIQHIFKQEGHAKAHHTHLYF